MKNFEELLAQVSAAAAEKVVNKVEKLFELARLIFDELTWDTYKEYFVKQDESRFYLGFDRNDSRSRTTATEVYLIVDPCNKLFAIDTGSAVKTTVPSFHTIKRIYEEDIKKSVKLSNDWFDQWKGLFDKDNRVDDMIINQINYRIYNKLCERDSNIKLLFETEKEFRNSEFGFNLSAEAKEKAYEIMDYLISEAKK